MSEFSMSVPFVTIESAGGVHDERSYVDGWNMGALSERLKMLASIGQLPDDELVRLDNLPQALLYASKNGYEVDVEELPDEWVGVGFRWPEDPDLEWGRLLGD